MVSRPTLAPLPEDMLGGNSGAVKDLPEVVSREFSISSAAAIPFMKPIDGSAGVDGVFAVHMRPDRSNNVTSVNVPPVSIATAYRMSPASSGALIRDKPIAASMEKTIDRRTVFRCFSVAPLNRLAVSRQDDAVVFGAASRLTKSARTSASTNSGSRSGMTPSATAAALQQNVTASERCRR